MSKKQQKLQKRRSNDNLSAMGDESASGIFDDANMKQAIDWLMRDCHVLPETIFDQQRWEAIGGDSLQHPFPKPWQTLIVTVPLWISKKLIGLVRPEHQHRE